MRRKLQYTVPSEYDGKKVIHYLRQEAKLSSRMVISLKNLSDGMLCNGVHVRTIDRLRTGDLLEINLPEDCNAIASQPIPLDVVYMDDDLLVLNKPAGLAMHPTHNHQGDTLANGVTAFLESQGKNCTFRAVGRLDKCTSGLVVCALHAVTASALAGKITKTYLALPGGYFSGSGTIDQKIYRPDPMKTLRAVGDHGDDAVTDWESLAAGQVCSLVRVKPRTGRTHQIRVHFAFSGAPLLGDEMYGADRALIDRAALHCESVAFVHPISGQRMFFRCEMPQDMVAAARKAGLKVEECTEFSL